MQPRSLTCYFQRTFFVIISLVFAFSVFSVPKAEAADKVKLRLHWKVGAEHVAFIVAMDKGFYDQEGIDISIKEGSGSTATLKLIGAGKETFGVCGTNVTVKGVAKGVPVIQVMLIEANKTQGVLSRPEAGIRTPQDLRGKIIAGSGSGVSDIFEAFLAANKLSIKDLTYLAAGKARLQVVASGRADGSLGNAMNDVLRLKAMGVSSPQTLLFNEWGLPPIGDGIIANLRTVKTEKDMVRRFVKASIRGINYTFMDIEKSAEIAKKHFPMTNKEQLVKQLAALKWLFNPPIGWQDPKVVAGIKNVIAEFGGMPQAKNMPVGKFFTNEFLPKF